MKLISPIKYNLVPFVEGEYIDGLLGEKINSKYSNFISDVIGFVKSFSNTDFVSYQFDQGYNLH